jgi:acyl carrier protein
MGLDGVELVMAFEEEFGVRIANAEAEICFTPAMVIDLVLGKLRSTEERVCSSQRAFHLLRRAAMETLGVARNRIVPEANLRALFEDRDERQASEVVRARLQARSWPPLARPIWMIAGLWIGSILVFCVGAALVHWSVAAIATVLFAGTAERATRPFRHCLPCSKVRDLVPYAMTSDFLSWKRSDVARAVRRIVVEQLGLRDGQYREDARFIEDLGMG